MSHHIANYTAEQAQFQELINTADNPNILMFQGASGSGKSHLIDHCLRTLPKDSLPHVQLRLQSGGETIPTLFNIIGSKIGRAKLPTFSQRVAGLIGKTFSTEDPIWPMQLRQYLREIGCNSDLDTRKDWYQQLTYAWFTDIVKLDTPLLLAIDTYEQSSSEFDAWFRDEFLYGVTTTSNLRVLIGGQALPQAPPEISTLISVHQLQGVTDAKEWMTWAESRQIEIPSLEWMARFCEKQKGHPAQIIQILETFPKIESGQPEPTETIYQRRKRIRETLGSAFSIDELKNICSDMEIDYENFPETKSSFIRELMAHLPRIGRYEEFITICKEERPHYHW